MQAESLYSQQEILFRVGYFVQCFVFCSMLRRINYHSVYPQSHSATRIDIHPTTISVITVTHQCSAAAADTAAWEARIVIPLITANQSASVASIERHRVAACTHRICCHGYRERESEVQSIWQIITRDVRLIC